ncbi:MAG: hypothetical protein ACOYN4_05260 [Bacteroidales bacterium]
MRKLWATVLAFLGVAAFVEVNGKKTITEEQKQSLTETFGPQFVAKLEGSLASDVDENIDTNASVIADLQAKLQLAEQEKANLASVKTALEAEKATFAQTIEAQKKTIGILSEKPENEPAAMTIADPKLSWDDANDKFLGGVQMPYMAIDDKHAYNKRAHADLMSKKFGLEIPVPKASSMDYSSLTTDLGDYYRVRKQDRIQSFLLGLPSLETIFPLESGYQDQAVLTNMFLTGDFSQAENTVGSTFDNMVQGGFKFEPEVITMYGVMFAHKFTDLKALEKNWLGYLNREGSNVMKWSFIEFVMVETAKKLQNEREIRRVSGIRSNPTANVLGTAIGASNGLRQFIKNQIALFKIRPFVMGEWTDTTISDYVRRGTSYVPIAVRDSGNVVLYMSPDAYTAYVRNNETLYGLNQDYKPGIKYVKEYPNVAIEVVPNMGESKRMIWTLAGNIRLFEDQPGEMVKFNFEQQDWGLKVWSNWKESLWAYMVGKKYASAAAVPTDYSTQLIFCNNVDLPEAYFIPMTADDTTPSVSVHKSLVSVANTAATAITTIDNASTGDIINIKCGSVTNAITIAKSGDFSLIAAAWSPGLDEVLTLVKRSDGKFLELSRTNATSLLTAFAADDATPSVSGASTFITNANTTATAITNLDDAVTDVLYTIHGAGSTNASTIANSGNFVLTAAMTLSVGKWITFRKSASDGKFIEINRG